MAVKGSDEETVCSLVVEQVIYVDEKYYWTFDRGGTAYSLITYIEVHFEGSSTEKSSVIQWG